LIKLIMYLYIVFTTCKHTKNINPNEIRKIEKKVLTKEKGDGIIARRSGDTRAKRVEKRALMRVDDSEIGEVWLDKTTSKKPLDRADGK